MRKPSIIRLAFSAHLAPRSGARSGRSVGQSGRRDPRQADHARSRFYAIPAQ